MAKKAKRAAAAEVAAPQFDRKLLSAWNVAAKLIASLGVYRAIPELRDQTLAWASRRAFNPRLLAIHYVTSLASYAYTLPGSSAAQAQL